MEGRAAQIVPWKMAQYVQMQIDRFHSDSSDRWAIVCIMSWSS